MASKYARQFTLPEGFENVLKNFTREVLRADPSDIYTFGAEYFTEALSRRNNPEEYAEPQRLSAEELKERIGQWFDEADVDGNGTLDRREFKAVFQGLKDELGITDKDILGIMAEADENQDGSIEYKEFVPIATEVVLSIYAKQDFEQEAATRAHDKEEALEDAREYLLHGMPREELEAALRDVFAQSDTDGNGWLSRKEFVECINGAELGFSRKEINVLLTEVDVDNDGKVTYDEFVPLCFTLLVELVSDTMVEVPQEEEELRQFFIDLFGAAADDDGKVSHAKAIELMRNAELGLTRVQLHAIMSEADEDDEGMLDFEQLANAISGMVLSLVNVQMQKDRADKYCEAMKEEAYNVVHGFSAEELQAALVKACADVDSSGSRLLALEDVKMVISQVLPNLPEQHSKAVMSIAKRNLNEDKLCKYDEVCAAAFEVIRYLQVNDKM